jgi:hypothetical protein
VNRTEKIIGLDIARSVAIFLAMLSHSLVTANVLNDIANVSPALKIAFRSSTPTFVVLFGVLLELVYLRTARENGISAVSKRMYHRAAQCYVLYVISLVPLVLTGKTSGFDALLSAALLGSTPFTDILRYYACLFIISPFILAFRIRFGLLSCVTVALAIQLLHPAISAIPDLPTVFNRHLLARIPNLLFGVGAHGSGPSVLHGLLFVAVGGLLGNALQAERLGRFAGKVVSVNPYIGLMAALALGTLAAVWMGPELVSIDSVSGLTLRSANHPLYFFGGAMLATLLIVTLRNVGDHGKGVWRLSMLGQRSLFTFCFGNSLLYLAPHSVGDSLSERVAKATILIACVFASTAIYDVLIVPQSRLSTNRLIRIASTSLQDGLNFINALISRISDSVAARVSRYLEAAAPARASFTA